jgi:hypothetical protein
MNGEASQDGSQRGQLLFRRTSAACNLLSDKLRDVRIHSEGSSSQAMSQDGAGQLLLQQQQQQQQQAASAQQAPKPKHHHHHHSTSQQQHTSQQGPPSRSASQQLRDRLTIDTTRHPSQTDMAW